MGDPFKTPEKSRDKTALDAAWQSSGSGAKVNRPKTEKDLAEAVRKALAASCKWAGPDEIDGTFHEGLTLRQRIERDKRAAAAGDTSKSFGKTYYLQLKEWYGAKTDVRQMLVMKPDHQVHPDLFKAISQMLRHPPNRSYMKAWAASCTTLQENDIVAMCRVLLELVPHASAEQLYTSVQIISGIERADGWVNHPQIHHVMQNKIDECLAQVLFTKHPTRQHGSPAKAII